VNGGRPVVVTSIGLVTACCVCSGQNNDRLHPGMRIRSAGASKTHHLQKPAIKPGRLHHEYDVLEGELYRQWEVDEQDT
jgi:hypothetical protein